MSAQDTPESVKALKRELGELIGTFQRTLHISRVTFDTMGEGAATLSADGTILYANHALGSIVFRMPEELMGKSALEVVRWGDHALFQTALQAAQEQGTSIGELSLLTPGGQEIPVLIRLKRLELDQAQAIAFCLVVTDLTNLKANQELQSKLQELERTNRGLEDLSQVKDDFVANVSHEIRTPLTAIKEGISLMRDEVLGTLSPKQLEFLKIVDQNVERLTELISNLLDLSKIEVGRMRLARRRVSLLELAKAVVKTIQPLSGTRALRIEEASLSEAFADPDRVYQVLMNLLSNAVKFTRENGAIAIRLKTEAGQVVVSVQDDGVGIAHEDIPRLFHKFSQVGQAGGPRRGTGLGLVLCKEIVEAHGGTIGVESEAGKGSTFTFALPAYAPELALEESWEECVKTLEQADRKSAGVIALDLSAVPSSKLADRIRPHLHQEDLVVEATPHVAAVIAIVDRAGAGRIAARLKEALESLGNVHLGVALYPQDGEEIHALFARAQERMGKDSGGGVVHAG